VESGRAEAMNNPANYGLYTPQMIADLNLGGVMLQKSGSTVTVAA
jgi:putative exporter of polyketide antibiotics